MSISWKPKLPVICLFGPTGVGKTDLLLDLFRDRGEIISADSMQVYRGMDIGTAKPSKELQNILPHHMLDIRNPDEQFHAGDFVALCDKLIPEILDRNKIPVISGGTAFYYRNFFYGLPETPPGSEDIRKELQEELDQKGNEELHRKLSEIDPESAQRIHVNDSYRILRAMEVYESSGKPLSSFKQEQCLRSEYNILCIGLERPRELLYRRIDQRVHEMFRQGLMDEVRNLIYSGFGKNDPGMAAIGYREFFQGGFPQNNDPEVFIEQIQQNSRRYAKRQITFFSSFTGELPVDWFQPEDKALKKVILEFLSRK